jgi:single-strand DNA-binding protein
MLDSKGSNSSGGAPKPAQSKASEPVSSNVELDDNLDDIDDDLPF